MVTWPDGINSREEWLKIAERWKASSIKKRQKLFERYGIRYSELLRLPYWDPTKFVVIDSMHGLLLANIKHHCRDLWGMDASAYDSDEVTGKPRSNNIPMAEMNDAWEILRHGTEAQLAKLKAKVLRQLCAEAALPTDGLKAKMPDQLREYVSAAVQYMHL
jgi:hypothetical protein